MDERIKKQLLELPNTSQGRALIEVLNDERTKLGDLSTLVSWEDGLMRKGKVELIKKILKLLEVEENETVKKAQYM